MATIAPFCGWRYSKNAGDIASLSSPLLDISETSQIENILKNPLNVLHLLQSDSSKEKTTLINQWIERQIIGKDPIPGIYCYSQTYRNPEQQMETVNGFICNVKLHEWSESIVLRHESTMPLGVKHRLQELENNQFHFCPTHGLYTDEDQQLESYIEESLEFPIMTFQDQTGIVNKVSVIHDLNVIQKFAKVLKEKQIILADGHHRYEASLKYRNKIAAVSATHPANYHPMFLSNTESNRMRIYPTHRLFKGLQPFNKQEIMQKLINFFSVNTVEDPYMLDKAIAGDKHSFGIVFEKEALKVKLKPGLEKDITWNFPDLIKDLDLTILHYFIIEKILKIEGKIQKNSKNINFSFNFTKTIDEVLQGHYQMAVITQEVTKEEIKKVCYSGYTLPHKSTYFYPKVVCGMVMSSLREEDFKIESELYQKEFI